jgi:integrase
VGENVVAGRVNLNPKTLAGYESLLRARILPRWGDVPLSKVSHAKVVAWVAQMRAGGLSASRTRQAYHLLSAMLDDAVSDGRLARNPAAKVDLPRLPTTERRYLTHGQVAELADGCGPYRTLVLTLAYLGLRWGEATASRVRRVDLLRGRVEIVEAVVDVNGAMNFRDAKSHESRFRVDSRFLRDDLAVQSRQGARRPGVHIARGVGAEGAELAPALLRPGGGRGGTRRPCAARVETHSGWTSRRGMLLCPQRAPRQPSRRSRK